MFVVSPFKLSDLKKVTILPKSIVIKVLEFKCYLLMLLGQKILSF